MRRRLITLFLLIVIIWILRELVCYAASVLLVGAALAVMISPLARRLEKLFRRSLSLALSWIILAGVLAAAAAILIPVVTHQLNSLGDLWNNVYHRANELLPMGYRLMQSAGLTAKIPDAAARIANCIGRGMGGMIDSLSRIGMMWIASLFLYMGKERYLLMGEMLLPLKYRAKLLLVGSRILREVKLFVRAQAAVSLCIGLMTMAGLLLLRMKGAILLGIIAGLLNMIPYFGPAAAAVPVLLSAISGGWKQIIASAVLLIAIQQADSCWLSPRILSGATGLSPLSVILSLAVGGAVFGLAGMLLAVPAAIAVRIVYSEWSQNSEISRY